MDKRDRISRVMTLKGGCRRRVEDYLNTREEIFDLLGPLLNTSSECDEVRYLAATWHHACGEYDAAMEIIRRGDYGDSINIGLYNLEGSIAAVRGEKEKAVRIFERVVAATELAQDAAHQSHYRTAAEQLSCLYLSAGDYARGWPLKVFANLTSKEFKVEGYLQGPRWCGGTLPAGPLLVCLEDGNGDSLQFGRYIPLIQKMGLNVLVLGPDPLKDLFRQSLGCDYFARSEMLNCLNSGFQWPHAHMNIEVAPLLFRTDLTNIPSGDYLRPRADLVANWGQRTAQYGSKSLRVGLVWAGNTTHANDRFRSSTLNAMSALAPIPGITFYSLQVGPKAVESTSPPPGMNLVNLTGEIRNYADTAAIISHLDLVITVDTSVCHLAGSLQVPTWTIVNHPAEWRWMEDRTDTPWYPSMRLFRQKDTGPLVAVMDDVAAALRTWAKENISVRQQSRQN